MDPIQEPLMQVQEDITRSTTPTARYLGKERQWQSLNSLHAGLRRPRINNLRSTQHLNQSASERNRTHSLLCPRLDPSVFHSQCSRICCRKGMRKNAVGC